MTTRKNNIWMWGNMLILTGFIHFKMYIIGWRRNVSTKLKSCSQTRKTAVKKKKNTKRKWHHREEDQILVMVSMSVLQPQIKKSFVKWIKINNQFFVHSWQKYKVSQCFHTLTSLYFVNMNKFWSWWQQRTSIKIGTETCLPLCHTLSGKRYKSGHWGCTFSKSTLLYLKGAYWYLNGTY